MPDRTRTDYHQCEIVVLSGQDYLEMRSPLAELSGMTIAEAQVIGAHVAVVWAIAWGFRAMRRAVLDYEREAD
jgi:hypothetical protein